MAAIISSEVVILTIRELREREAKALKLVASYGGGISCDDEHTEEFSDDGDPDTWNRLFAKNLAQQWGPGFAGDEFSIRITKAGLALLRSLDAEG